MKISRGPGVRGCWIVARFERALHTLIRIGLIVPVEQTLEYRYLKKER